MKWAKINGRKKGIPKCFDVGLKEETVGLSSQAQYAYADQQVDLDFSNWICPTDQQVGGLNANGLSSRGWVESPVFWHGSFPGSESFRGWVLFVLGYCLIADEGSVEWVEEENPMGVVKEVGNKENRVALGVVGGVKGQCLGVGSVMVCFGCKEMVDVGDGSLIEK
ncbi:hypothetical protein V6N13_135373 [Hibiscus sabdariffa]